MSRDTNEILKTVEEWAGEYDSLLVKLLESCEEYKDTAVYKKLLGKQEVIKDLSAFLVLLKTVYVDKEKETEE